jgi:hypothetical protein
MRFLLCIILVLSLSAKAQLVKGIVCDSITLHPIQYVNVGIVGKNIGTVSNESGLFEIDLSRAVNTDTIRFSMIGYATINYTVFDFKKWQEGMPQAKIYLQEKPTQLTEVVVKSSSPTIKLGIEPKSRLVNAGFISNQLGYEIGTLYTTSLSSLSIDSVQLNFARCAFDSVFVRLNIYQIEGETKNRNVMPKPFYVKFTRKEARNGIIIPLHQIPILVSEKFIVSLELVRTLGNNKLDLYADLNTDKYPAIYRLTSQGDWNFMLHKTKHAGVSIIVFGH